MEPSTSKALNTFCAICHQHQAIYTCPRCAIHTCSLACSQSHKSIQSCSGERDKTAYVPMNKYGWGTMANDYTYLEEVGRKSAEWGLDIVKGSFWTNTALASRGRGLGKDSRRAPRGSNRGNREVLRMYLDDIDIDMEILPPGMQRRRVNQSTWDVKSKSPLMTIEFVFHRTKDSFAPADSPEPLPLVILTHRNNLKAKISDIIHRHFRNQRNGIPSWVRSLISSLENEDTELVYFMCQHSNTPSSLISKAYHKLDSTQSLLTALRNRTFVEYPTIDVWEQGDFTGALVEADGTILEAEEESRPVKRRRLDAVGGRKLIKSLLGGYTSCEEEKVEEGNVLGLLGGYGSDDESLNSAEPEGHDSEEVDGIEDPPALSDVRDILECVDVNLFKEDQAEWVNDAEVDWSDSSDAEAELERIPQR